MNYEPKKLYVIYRRDTNKFFLKEEDCDTYMWGYFNKCKLFEDYKEAKVYLDYYSGLAEKPIGEILEIDLTKWMAKEIINEN